LTRLLRPAYFQRQWCRAVGGKGERIPEGIRRYAPGIVTFVVGGVITFASPYVYPVDRSDPAGLWGHLLAGVYWLTRKMAEGR
jgi:hypothetical protein